MDQSLGFGGTLAVARAWLKFCLALAFVAFGIGLMRPLIFGRPSHFAPPAAPPIDAAFAWVGAGLESGLVGVRSFGSVAVSFCAFVAFVVVVAELEALVRLAFRYPIRRVAAAAEIGGSTAYRSTTIVIDPSPQPPPVGAGLRILFRILRWAAGATDGHPFLGWGMRVLATVIVVVGVAPFGTVAFALAANYGLARGFFRVVAARIAGGPVRVRFPA